MHLSPSETHPPTLVRRTLLANAIFSAFSGAVLVGLRTVLAPLFGLESATLLVIIGTGLLLFAALVGASARRPRPDRGRVSAFAVADASWVGGSVVVLILAWDALTPLGRVLIAGAALVVATFAYLQLFGLREAASTRSSGEELSLGRRIWLSWRSMKPWVKIWLFFLNGVFLAALVFPPQPLTLWVLAAYLASGPLLAGMMAWQGGLTRLLGLAHLIPWTPLVVYLLLRLTGDVAGPQVGPNTDGTLFLWVLILLATVTVCLAFDVYDVVRWVRGERFVLGSPAAARAKASSLTLEEGGAIPSKPELRK